MKNVTIYTTQTCPYCRAAERFLDGHGIPYTRIDVTSDPALREKLVELSEGRRTVPQIFIGGRPIGGHSDLMALHQSGALSGLLEHDIPRT